MIKFKQDWVKYLNISSPQEWYELSKLIFKLGFEGIDTDLETIGNIKIKKFWNEIRKDLLTPIKKVSASTRDFITKYLTPNSGVYTTKKFSTMVSKKVDWDYISNYIRSMDYHEFLKTDYWLLIRQEVRDRDRKCVLCGKNYKLQAHHTTYDIRGNEHNNLDKIITLCKECHSKVHGE